MLLVLLSACTEEPFAEEESATGPCLACSVCAIATFDGPAYEARGFFSSAQARAWLAKQPGLTGKQIVAGSCDAIGCPDVWQPLCGSVAAERVQTFSNACELESATRDAAGAMPLGDATGITLHLGPCEPASYDPGTVE